MAHVVRNLPVMQETQVLSLDQEDSPGEGNGYPLQDSCLENPMDRGYSPWGRKQSGMTERRTLSFFFSQHAVCFQVGNFRPHSWHHGRERVFCVEIQGQFPVTVHFWAPGEFLLVQGPLVVLLCSIHMAFRWRSQRAGR